MMTRLLSAAVFALIGLGISSDAASQTLRQMPQRERVAWRGAQCATWHGRYRHVEWGSPVALVVPPTATFQTNWGWGVANTRISRTNHQFARPYPGPSGGFGFRPTPWWPQDTNQFGVYYVRGPW